MDLFRSVSLLFLLPLCLTGQIEIPSFKEVLINNDDGLNSWLMIEHIEQTPDGALWFLINEGVYRYNGIRAVNVSRFLSTRTEHRLTDQQATCFTFDSEGVLWLGRRKGLYKIDLDRLDIVKIALDEPMRPSNHRNYILQIEEHRDTMYVGTANGLYLVDRNSGSKLKGYLNHGDLPERFRETTKSVKSIYPGIEEGIIWVALMDGLYRISKKDDRFERYTIPDQWSDSLSHNFFPSDQISDKIYFPSWGLGMVSFEFETKRFHRYPTSDQQRDAHDHNTIRTTIPVNDSLMFLSASRIGNGIFNRNSNTYTWLPTPDEMKQTWATQLFRDMNGFIWSAQTGRIFRTEEPIPGDFGPSPAVLDISAVYVNGKLQTIPALLKNPLLELNEYQKDVGLEFTLTRPHTFTSVTYEYRLWNGPWKPIPDDNFLQLSLKTGSNPVYLRALSAKGTPIAETELGLSVVVPFYKTIWFLVLVALFLITTTYFLVHYRNEKALINKLQELDMAKSKFFNNISHEFRTPLTIMASPLQRRLEHDVVDPLDKKEFGLILKSNRRLLHLVDQLLELSKLESGNAKLMVSLVHLAPFLNTLAEPFQYQAENRGKAFQFNNQLSEASVWCDAQALQTILTNLLSNAIKYSEEGGHIELEAKYHKHILKVRVENSGQPLAKDQQERLFDRFYQTDPNNIGVGIGLALAKELVELHKGKIWIDRFYKEGTAFEIELPIHKSAYAVSEITSVKENKVMELVTLEEALSETLDAEADDDKPHILVVEDNDDLRAILVENFKESFKVSTAGDGLEGEAKAIGIVPDLIVSDIMMPHKNGIDMTKALKQNELTAHIPIILLTAKAGSENELVGAQIGADDYMTKPFNNTLLKTKMLNLLALRQKMRSRYSQEVVLKPKDIAISPPDEVLLKRLQAVLDSNLTESSFSAHDFAREMGFSRMQLHRKLKALTGLSTTGFIRSQRLKLAVQLLEKSDANVSEACYRSGFNNLSYFAKCFKNAYGVSPSEYSNKA
ncbi:ATP-binding protein [Flagellimonas sp. DF-77]|uniref:ATP-binding protein n=1 Tax=Flagellimonas algarum TaxID=3230298 RepID=UPI0033994656